MANTNKQIGKIVYTIGKTGRPTVSQVSGKVFGKALKEEILNSKDLSKEEKKIIQKIFNGEPTQVKIQAYSKGEGGYAARKSVGDAFEYYVYEAFQNHGKLSGKPPDQRLLNSQKQLSAQDLRVIQLSAQHAVEQWYQTVGKGKKLKAIQSKGAGSSLGDIILVQDDNKQIIIECKFRTRQGGQIYNWRPTDSAFTETLRSFVTPPEGLGKDYYRVKGVPVWRSSTSDLNTRNWTTNVKHLAVAMDAGAYIPQQSGTSNLNEIFAWLCYKGQKLDHNTFSQKAMIVGQPYLNFKGESLKGTASIVIDYEQQLNNIINQQGALTVDYSHDGTGQTAYFKIGGEKIASFYIESNSSGVITKASHVDKNPEGWKNTQFIFMLSQKYFE